MSFPVLLQSSARLTQSIYYGKPSVGAVPLTRNINTSLPLTGGGSLVGDLTLGAQVSPGGATTVVGTTRQLISSTTALTFNAGSSTTLAGDVTAAIAAFAGTTPGLVPTGTSDGTKFLSQTGWQVGIAVGVSSLTAGSGIAVSAATGAVTVSGTIANITTSGDAPATGGTDPTKVLTMTNPISWQVAPGAGPPAINLQGGTPGTQQTGNGNISGTFIANTELIAGSGNASLNGLGHEPLYVKQGTPSALPVVASYFSGSPNPGILFRSARGTEASPSNTNSGDEKVSLQASTWLASTYDQAEFFAVTQRQSAVNQVPHDIDLTSRTGVAGQAFSQIRMSGNSFAGIGSPLNTAPLSGWEIQTSLGLLLTSKSATFTGGEYDLMYNCDSTAGSITANVVAAGGRANRVIGFRKVDTTTNTVVITPAGGLIDGLATRTLTGANEFVFIQSDGTNWFTFGSNRPIQEQSKYTPGADTLSNTTGPQGFATNFVIDSGKTYTKGGMFHARWTGTVSCTGTPTFSLQPYWTSGSNVLSDSGAFTLPNNLANGPWVVDLWAAIEESGPNIAGLNATFWMPTTGTAPFVSTAILGTTGATTFTGTGPIGLQIRFSAANPSNTTTCTSGFMQYFPPGLHQ